MFTGAHWNPVYAATDLSSDLETFHQAQEWLSTNCGRSYFKKGDGYKQNKNSTVKDGIKAYQRILCELGYSVGIDGSFGPDTYNKTKELQKMLDVTADGLPGKGTYEKLKEKYGAPPKTSHGRTVIYPSEGRYSILTACNTGFAIDVCGAMTEEETIIHLWTYWDGNEAQVFELKKAYDEWYKIFYVKNPKMLVNVMYGYNGNDARLWLYHDDNTDACLFRFLDAGNGEVIIESKLGKVIDLDNGIAFDDAKVHMWDFDCYNTWVLHPVKPSVDVQKMIDYAEANWNKKKGKCAEFASDCLAAGGINVPNCSMYNSSIVNRAGRSLGTYNNPYIAAPALLQWFDDQGYTIIENPSASDINLGDIAFMYTGSNTNPDGHVVVITGINSSGQYTFSAHNNPQRAHKVDYSGVNRVRWVVKINYSNDGLTPIR